MILVDTSAWIDFFRDRDPIASAVDHALRDNEAAFCGPVETELRRGFANARERNKVLPLLHGCHFLSQPDDLWIAAGELGFALRRRGVSPKTMDLLIAAYALGQSVGLLTADKDFRAMAKANVSLTLV